MITSPYISFEGASETRRKHPKEIAPPLFARINQCYVDTSDHFITTAIPSYSFPSAPTIPATPARTRVEDDVLNVAAAGIGYTTASGTVTGGGGTNATVQLILNGIGGITGIFVTNPGTGYATAPTISLANGAGGSVTVVNWTFTDYTAWFQLGAYVILLGATSHTRRIRWCAPGRPTVWDRYESVNGIEVLTGAGYTDLPGSGALSSGVALGSSGVLFDASGIGVLALTGDWEAPFAYAQTLNGVTAQSTTRYLDGKVVFVGNDGRIWFTTGYETSPVDGPLDLDTISEITWPPASTAAEFALNTATSHYVIHPAHTSGNGSHIWVDRFTGAYSTADGDDTAKYFTTGILQLTPESDRVHIQRVRLHWSASGSFSGNCAATVGCKGYYESSWHTSSATLSIISAVGSAETEIEVNYTCKLPHFKFTVTMPSGATTKFYGMTVMYDTGGLR